MGRKSGKRPGPPQQQGGPSLFFIIALALGIVLLFWGAWTVVRQPQPRPKPLGRITITRTIDAS
jgi:hypothetical protein